MEMMIAKTYRKWTGLEIGNCAEKIVISLEMFTKIKQYEDE